MPENGTCQLHAQGDIFSKFGDEGRNTEKRVQTATFRNTAPR